MLLLQDIAVIPMLAIIPLLAVPGIYPSGGEGGHSSLSLVEHLPGWAHGLVVVGAIVLLNYSTQNRVIQADTAQTLSLVVALSMFLTPLLFIVYDRVVLPRYQKASNEEAEPDEIEEQAPVIVAGVGRFGQIVCRLLRANGQSRITKTKRPA